MNFKKLRKWALLVGGLAVYQVAGCSVLDQYQTQLQDLLKMVFPTISP